MPPISLAVSRCSTSSAWKSAICAASSGSASPSAERVALRLIMAVDLGLDRDGARHRRLRARATPCRAERIAGDVPQRVEQRRADPPPRQQLVEHREVARLLRLHPPDRRRDGGRGRPSPQAARHRSAPRHIRRRGRRGSSGRSFRSATTPRFRSRSRSARCTPPSTRRTASTPPHRSGSSARRARRRCLVACERRRRCTPAARPTSDIRPRRGRSRSPPTTRTQTAATRDDAAVVAPAPREQPERRARRRAASAATGTSRTARRWPRYWNASAPPSSAALPVRTSALAALEDIAVHQIGGDQHAATSATRWKCASI